MGQVVHGISLTTEAVRRAIQLRQESVRAAAKRYGVSPTTIQKWRARQSTADAAMGPKEPRSTVLTPEEEAVIVAFRRHTLLPLDDCLYGLQPTIPHLSDQAGRYRHHRTLPGSMPSDPRRSGRRRRPRRHGLVHPGRQGLADRASEPRRSAEAVARLRRGGHDLHGCF